MLFNSSVLCCSCCCCYSSAQSAHARGTICGLDDGVFVHIYGKGTAHRPTHLKEGGVWLAAFFLGSTHKGWWGHDYFLSSLLWFTHTQITHKVTPCSRLLAFSRFLRHVTSSPHTITHSTGLLAFLPPTHLPPPLYPWLVMSVKGLAKQRTRWGCVATPSSSSMVRFLLLKLSPSIMLSSVGLGCVGAWV